MEVRQARYFLAIADHGTTGRAAAALHMTQPALSQSIVNLERELHVQLFKRSPKGMQLTEAGEALVGPARRLVESSVRAVAVLEGIKDVPHGKLNVSVMPALALTPVSVWIARLREKYPQVSVHLDPHFGEESVARFFEITPVDVLVSFLDEPGSDVIKRIPIGSQEMVLALPPGALTPDEPSLGFTDIAHLPFVVAPTHTSMRRILDREFTRIGSELVVAAESPFMDTILALVSEGVGCALVPAQGAERLREVGVVIKHPDPPINREYFIYYSTQRLSYAAHAFIRLATAGQRSAAV